MYLNEVVSLYHVFRSAALAASTAMVVAAAPSAVPVFATATTELEHLVAQPSPPTTDLEELADFADILQARTSNRKYGHKVTVKRSARYHRSARSSRSTSRSVSVTRARPKAVASSSALATAPGSYAGAIALQFAYAQLGKAYRSSTAGPNSYDCSGLTMAAWKAAGFSLPHNAAAQYQRAVHVDRSALRPGDLIFYYKGVSHVGIYAGQNMVIDAPHAGKPVSLRKMDTMPIVAFGRPATV